VNPDDDTGTVDDADLGVLERQGDRAVVRFTRLLPYPRTLVWRALTEPDHLAAWFPTTIDGERKAGAALHFAFRDKEAPAFDGEMVTFDPPAVLALQWGDETLRFELTAHDEGCLLVFTAGFDELGKVARDGAGWHACLDRLAWALSGRTAPTSAPDRWREVRDVYIESFGPEFSTIGPPEEWERAHGPGSEPPA
jgi:uncharacterized protein YndB with AHSA1/START domain